jgi:primosomal protein N' (replication factor Y)
LLPEIALTTQLVGRLRTYFGKVAVFHSKYSNNERLKFEPSSDQFEKAQVVIEQGRLYFAFYNLGFIIVDEEHEQTFKQVDPAPRYHARTLLLFYRINKSTFGFTQVLKPILMPNQINLV